MARAPRDSREFRPGIDYPADRNDFDRLFRTDAHCLAFLTKLRWPGQFECPYCDYKGEAAANVRGQYVCRGCRRQVSPLAGTVFEGTRTPLRTWFLIAWDMVADKSGTSALNAKRQTGLATYKTAWTTSHKLRRCMVNPERDKLRGKVEVDDAYFGGVESGVHGRETYTKSMVLVAVELVGPIDRKRGMARMGRARLRRVDAINQETVAAFVLSTIEQGSELVTDGSHTFNPLEQPWPEEPDGAPRYRRTKHVQSKPGQDYKLPHAHRIISEAKRWILGVHQGSMSPKQLDFYLDEYVFRFNRRHSRDRGRLFYRLLERAVQTPPVTRAKVVSSFPQMLVTPVYDQLRANGVLPVVAGGWALDGLLGRQTRVHSDLDLLIPARFRSHAIRALETVVIINERGERIELPGWMPVTEVPDWKVTLERASDRTRIDLHLCERVRGGGLRELVPAQAAPAVAEEDEAPPPRQKRRKQLRPVYRRYPPRPRRTPTGTPALVFEYQPEDLKATAVFSPYAIDCLSPQAQLDRRTGYRPTAEDLIDLPLLRQLAAGQIPLAAASGDEDY